MSVRTMARVWDLSRNKGSDLLMLLAIADFSDDDGNAYPAVATLAAKCRMKTRNANLILAALRASGELEVRQNEGPHGTNRYRVVLPALPLHKSTALQKSTGLQNITRTPVEPCPKPLQRPTDEPSVNHQEPSTRPTSSKSAFPSEILGRKKTSPVSLKTWLEECKANDQVPIQEDSAVFTFAEKAGIPPEFLEIAWCEFKKRHVDSSKRQKDWRLTFLNCIRGNWYRIWFVSDGDQIQLTSQGRILKKDHLEVGQ